mgnify:FL=1
MLKILIYGISRYKISYVKEVLRNKTITYLDAREYAVDNEKNKIKRLVYMQVSFVAHTFLRIGVMRYRPIIRYIYQYMPYTPDVKVFVMYEVA